MKKIIPKLIGKQSIYRYTLENYQEKQETAVITVNSKGNLRKITAVMVLIHSATVKSLSQKKNVSTTVVHESNKTFFKDFTRI